MQPEAVPPDAHALTMPIEADSFSVSSSVLSLIQNHAKNAGRDVVEIIVLHQVYTARSIVTTRNQLPGGLTMSRTSAAAHLSPMTGARSGDPADEMAEVLSIIEAIYETVLDPGLWPQVLERISKHIGEGCAGISLIDTRDYSIKIAAQWGASESFMRDLAETMTFNPATNAHWYRDVDDPFSVEQLIGKRAFRSSRFYREVGVKHDFPDALTSILSKSGDRSGSISLPRSSAHGPVTEQDILRLRRLAPHIRRAVLMTDLLDSFALKESLLTQTLDRLRTPILLIGRRQHIVQANAAAKALLDSGIGLRRVGDTLRIDDPSIAAAFTTSLANLHATLSGSRATTTGSTGACVVIGEGSEQERALWLLPLDGPRHGRSGGEDAQTVAVLVTQSSASFSLPGEIFARRYGLTPAECRVLAQLISGAPPVAVAEHLGVSINTVRSHMQKLFSKTGCNGLPELLKTTARFLPPSL